MKLSKLIAGGIAMSLLISSVATAQGYNPMLDDKWRVYVGAFDASVDSKLTLYAENLPEIPPIDVEDILGLEDSKTVAWGGVAWHFRRRHALELETFTLNRNDSQSDTYTPALQIGDFFIEDGQLSTSYDTNLSRLTYAYSLIRNERSDLQIKGGLHLATLAVKVQLAGSVCGPETDPVEPPGCPAASSGNDSESVSAPLPHFGLSYTYAFTPTVGMNLGVKGFAIEIEDIEGSIIEVDADVAWQPFRHIGFGAGFRYFKTEVDSRGSNLNANIKFEYFGPSVYIHATF
jgi:hypothetical protein